MNFPGKNDENQQQSGMVDVARQEIDYLNFRRVIQKLDEVHPAHNSKGLVMPRFLACITQILNKTETEKWRDAFTNGGRSALGFHKVCNIE